MSNAAGKGRGGSWTGGAHEALLIAFSRMHGSIKPEQQLTLVKEMKEQGFDTTWEAIRQHLQKLKRKENGNTSGASAPTTPSKPKGGSKTTTPRSKKGKKRTLADEDDDDDDDIDEFKPVKKLKFERDSDIKEEDQEGDGEV